MLSLYAKIHFVFGCQFLDFFFEFTALLNCHIFSINILLRFTLFETNAAIPPTFVILLCFDALRFNR